jgi:hypothetical protein
MHKHMCECDCSHISANVIQHMMQQHICWFCLRICKAWTGQCRVFHLLWINCGKYEAQLRKCRVYIDPTTCVTFCAWPLL